MHHKVPCVSQMLTKAFFHFVPQALYVTAHSYLQERVNLHTHTVTFSLGPEGSESQCTPLAYAVGPIEVMAFILLCLCCFEDILTICLWLSMGFVERQLELNQHKRHRMA